MPIRATHFQRNGSIFVKNFDEGIFRSLGTFVDTSRTRDIPVRLLTIKDAEFQTGFDEEHNVPVVTDTIPVVFNTPESVFSALILPMAVIRRDTITPDLARWHPESYEYQVPAAGSKVVNIPDTVPVEQGAAFLERKVRSWPVDITYTIEIVARYRDDANIVLRKVLTTFQPYSNITVLDSLKEVRTYLAVNEGWNDLTELLDIVGRVVGYSVSILVEGELDLNDPETLKTVEKFEFETIIKI